jgi:hypothetical protein
VRLRPVSPAPVPLLPNCGRQLLNVRLKYEDSIEFHGDGWSKAFLVRVDKQTLRSISSPLLAKNGLWFDDAAGTRHLIEALPLYNQLADPRREMLVKP